MQHPTSTSTSTSTILNPYSYSMFWISDTDFELQKYIGTSNEFIKSLKKNCTPNLVNVGSALPIEETLILASCNYENGTKWGTEVYIFYINKCEHSDTHLIWIGTCILLRWIILMDPKINKH
jgi:hypothetical protein